VLKSTEHPPDLAGSMFPKDLPCIARPPKHPQAPKIWTLTPSVLEN
jgi:hypothetical protein